MGIESLAGWRIRQVVPQIEGRYVGWDARFAVLLTV